MFDNGMRLVTLLLALAFYVAILGGIVVGIVALARGARRRGRERRQMLEHLANLEALARRDAGAPPRP